MKNLILIPILTALFFTGCTSSNQNSDTVISEQKAAQAAEWVKLQSGMIQETVALIVRTAVFATNKDSGERAELNAVLHTMGEQINGMLNAGEYDPAKITAALKAEDPAYQAIFGAVGLVYKAKLADFQKNGYGDFSIEVLKALSSGLADGSKE